MHLRRAILILLSIVLATANVSAQKQIKAPELNGGEGWLNVDKPLTLAGLRGKVVLLDFWTYGCINCIHIIPDLKKLEAKYPKNLAVIGVHSAKFENESETDNIRNIIVRYGIEHPVVNDSDYRIWNRFGVRAWPTRVLIDPNGYIIGRYSGEGDYDEIDATIAAAVKLARAKGELDETPLKLALERAKVGDLPLAYPGKVLADAASGRLFIADSNHNRIVVTDFDGKLIETIGTGAADFKDGGFDSCAFNQPQGLAVGGDKLYVADRENHRIRLVDLKKKTVTTIAGTGIIDDFVNIGGDALKTALRSPWDVSLAGSYLFVAMAGSHQIWRMDVAKNYIEPYAGNRIEARIDGKRLNASFAQPSGLANDGRSLFVADSESNIIRRIDLRTERVETLVGGDLFEFGDVDGTGDDVRLQHPLGLALNDGKVLIADTYNHRIKSLDPDDRSVKTLFGNGKPAQVDGRNASFYEPGGISIAGGRLYVADTNNHAIRVVDLKTKLTSTLMIRGLKPPSPVEPDGEAVIPNRQVITLEPREVSADAMNAVSIDLSFPEGYHLNPNAPHRLEISTESSARRFKSLPLTVPFKAAANATEITMKATITYCREDNTGVCRLTLLVWVIPVKSVPGKPAVTIGVSAKIE